MRAARARAGAVVDADPPARPPCGAAWRARAHGGVAREVRARDPPPRADRGARGRGAVRPRAEGLVGDAAQAQPDRRRADLRARARRARRRRSSGSRTSRSGTSATSRTRPPSGSSCPTRSSRSTTCSTASPGSSKGLVVCPERMRRNLEASHGLFFSQRVLLALVESGLARDDGVRARPAKRDARLGGGAGLSRARPCRLRDLRPARCRGARRGLRSRGRTPATSTPSSSACAPCSPKRRSPSMPETAIHVGSGKVRELYALDDERLLLVASDRISTFDVVLPTEIPDKGRVLTGLSAFWFARTREIVANHLLAHARRRPLDGVPARSRCCRSSASSAATSPGPAGRTTSRRGEVCGHALPAGLRESDAASRADLHAGDEGADGPRREHRRRAQAVELVGRGAAPRGRAGLARALPLRRGVRARARDHDRRHEVRVRARRRRDGSCLGDEALTPDSSRFWPADEYAPGRGAAVVRQAVRPRLLRDARLGQDRAGAGAPGRRRRGHTRALRRGVRAADGDPVRPTTSPIPEVVLR